MIASERHQLGPRPRGGACQFDRCCPNQGMVSADVSQEAGILHEGDFNPLLRSRPNPLDDEFKKSDRPPGSRASTVEPGAWWASSFRFCKSMGGGFSAFLKSFHRKPSSPATSRATAVLWPMPMPYPKVFVHRSPSVIESRKDDQLQRAVNLLVASLDWLHLRRAQVCPEEVLLFRPLSKVQWRVVKFMEQALAAWQECEPVTSEAMGRSAGKVEDIEDALGRLASLEYSVDDSFNDILPQASGTSIASLKRAFFAPGLQKQSAGEVVGRIPGFSPMVAKKLIADRLDFKGEPCFDPAPFLDSKSRATFQCPIEQALRPGEAPEDPPRVRVFGSEDEVWKLLKKLDSSGRLGALRECDVLEGYQAGLFAVGKSSTHDRLIFDSRPFNTLERPMRRWIGSMGAAASLCDLHVAEDSILRTSGTDLREFYYSFAVSEQRLRRNSLLISVKPEDLRGFRCYDPAFEQEGRPIYLGLRTLAMGDSMAVELAQTAHLGILIQLELLDEDTLLSMDLPAPRTSFFAGVVIDDLVLFEIVAKSAVGATPGIGSMKLTTALDRYKQLGLMPHEGKTFHDCVDAEFWGAHVEGRRGFVRANLKRVIPILFATLGVLKLGVCTVSLLEILVGCWTSIFLFKRRMLCLLNICYEALQRQIDRREVIRLSQGLKEELLLCICLVPLAATFIKARDSAYIYESDASTWGWAVCRADLPEWLRSEIHRHRLRKSVWSKLLSPLKSWQRVKGILPAAEELPDNQCLASHPLHIEIGSCLQFVELEKRKSSQDVHINVLELRGMVHSERAAALTHFPGRSFLLSDSQVSLGAWLKGRSSSVALNQELQQSLPIHLGCGMVSNCGYIPSEVNAADDPTRHCAVRAPEKVPELWMDPKNFVDMDAQLEAFDCWLKSYAADPYSISGLPDMQELRVPLDDETSNLSHSQLFFKKKESRCT